MDDDFEYDLSPFQEFLDQLMCQNHIKVIHVIAEESDPPVAYPPKQLIIYNDNYCTDIASAFIEAHELFHVLHPSNNQTLYSFSPLAKRSEEVAAHLFALRLFFKSLDIEYLPNYIAIIDALGLPFSMEHLVKQVWFEFETIL